MASYGKLGSAVFVSFKLVSIVFLFFVVSCQEAKSGLRIDSGGPINSSNQKTFRVSGVCPNDGDSIAIVEAGKGGDSVLGQSNCVGQKFALNTDLSQKDDGEVRLVAITKQNNNGNEQVLVSKEALFLKNTNSLEIEMTLPWTGGFINAQNVSRRFVRGNCLGGERISFSVNTQTLGEAKCARGRFSDFLDFSAVSEGPFSLVAAIRDKAGNKDTHAVELVKDTVAPEHSVTNIPEGSFINIEKDKGLILAGNCNDAKAGVYFLAGPIPMGYSLCDGNRFESVLDFSSLGNVQGEFSLIGIVKDIANNTSSFSFRLLRDTIAPQISLTAPTHLANRAGQKEFVVSGLCDEHEAMIHFSSGEVDLGTTICKQGVKGSESGYFRTEFDLTTFPDGIIALSATLEDRAGNSSMASFSITKDTTLPDIAINNSLASGFVNSSDMAKVFIDGSCDEEGATIFFAEDDLLQEGPEGVLGQTECEGGRFQTELDLSRSGEGNLRVVAAVEDSFGNRGTSVLVLVKDSITPMVALTNPAAGSFVNHSSVASVNIAGTCNDVEAVIQISYSEQVLATPACDGNNFKANLDLSAVADGALELAARISDRAGNSSSSTLALVKDATVPVIALTVPAAGSFVNHSSVASVNIAGTCNDVEAAIQISHGAQVLATPACDGSNFKAYLDLSAAAEGALELVAKISDRAGNTSSSTLALIKDATVPVIALASPAAGSFVNHSSVASVNIVGTCNDAEAEIQISHGAQVLAMLDCDGNNFNANLDLSAAIDGALELVAKISDRAGNSSSSTLALVKDATVPVIALTSPATGSFVNHSNVASVNISGTCNDTETAIQISHGAQVLAMLDCDGSNFKAYLDLSAAIDGALELVAKISDRAGNSSSSTLALVKDATVPVIALTSPAAGSFVNHSSVASVNISGTCNDAEAAIQISHGAQVLAMLDCDGSNFKAYLDLSAAIDGALELVAKISDRAGNTSSSTLELVKDATVPVIALASPAAGSFVNNANMNAVKISGTCSDVEMKIQIFLGSQTLETVTCDGKNFKAYLDLSAAAEGVLELVARATDSAKNSSSLTLNLVKDAIVPTMAFTNPTEGSFVSNINVSSVNISGTCDDAEAEIRIAHAEQTLGSVDCDGNNFEANLDLSANAEGELNLVATIKDRAGNIGLFIHPLIKDTIAPHLSMIAPVLFASLENQSKFMVAGTCDIPQGNIHFFSGETRLGSTFCIPGGHFRAMLDLSKISDGTFPLSAAIQDQAQNISEASLLVTKDTAAPELAMTNLAEGESFINFDNQTLVPISGYCNEEGATIAFVGVESGSSNLKKTLGEARCENGLFHTDLDLSSYSEGKLNIVAMVEDGTGNSATSIVELVKDATVPTIAFVHPSPESFVNSANVASVNISGTCDDAEAAILISHGSQTLATTNCDGSVFETSLNLSEFNEGALDLVATIEDGAGNSTTSSLSLIKDATIPVIAFNHPSPGSFVNSTNVRAVSIAGTCDDTTTAIRISDGTQTLATTNCDGSAFAVDLDLSAMVEGSLNLMASVTDKAGNSQTASLELIKDTIIPTIAFTHPDLGSFVNSTNVGAMNVSGNCDDSEAQIQIFNGTQTLAIVDCNGSTFETSLNLSAVAEGDFTLMASIEDNAGNSASSSLDLTKDVIIPEIALTVPLNGSFVGSANVGSVSITGTCDDTQSQIQITDGAQTLATAVCNNGTFTADLDLSGSAEGTLNLMARAEDSAGNANNFDHILIKDTVAPQLTAVPATIFAGQANQKQFIVAGSCDLLSAKVHFYVNENSLGSVDCVKEAEEDALGYFHAALEVDQISDGTFSLSVKIQDLAGNASETNFSIIKDTVAPNIVITNPGNESIVNTNNANSVSIQGNCDEEDGKIILMEGDSKLGETLCDGNNFRIDLDLNDRDEGPLVIEVHIQDQLGNTEVTEVSLLKDTTLPKTIIVNNQSENFINQANSQTFEISGNCEELGAEIRFSFESKNLGTTVCDGESFDTTLDLSSLPEGSILLTTTIEDASGNLNTSSLELTKDSVSPTFELIHPTSESLVGADNVDSVMVAGTCNDADASIKIVKGNNVLATVDCDNKSFKTYLNLSSHAEGQTNFTIIISDKAKNLATSSFNLIKDTIAPEMAFTSPMADSLINASDMKAVLVSGTCNDPAAKIQILDKVISCDGGKFATNLDLSASREGALNLVAAIRDRAGNSQTSSLDLMKDITAPAIAFTHPAPKSFINISNMNSLSVEGTCNDSTAKIKIFDQAINCDGETFAINLNLNAVDEGMLDLVATIEDKAGNSSVSSLNLIKDTTAPVIAFTNPSADSFINAKNARVVSVSGTCNDPKAKIQVLNQVINCDGETFTTNLDLNEADEGTLNLVATIKDQASNSATTSLALMKDTTVPLIAFTTPLANSFVNSMNMEAISVSGTCSDSTAKIQIFDEVINCDGETFTTNLDLSTADEGALNLVATIEDKAGNSGSASLALTKDTIIPRIAFAHPQTGSFINNANMSAVAVSGTCSDSTAKIQIFDEVINCDGETFTTNLDLSAADEGALDLVANIKDGAGNTATASLNLVKDSIAPDIAFVLPLANDFVSSANVRAITVSGTCSDSTAKIQIFNEVINCDGETFTTNLDLSAADEGALNLVAKIEDKAGNSQNASLNLIKDTLAPTIAFTRPAVKSFVSNANAKSFAVSGTCNDSAAKIQIFDQMINCDGEAFATNLDLSSLSEGVLDVVAMIKDTAGNTQTSSLNLIKDTLAPTIGFSGPVAHSFISSSDMDSVNISGNCNDREAKILIFNKVINCDGVSFSTNLDLSSQQEGAFQLVATIEDKAGNSATSSLSLVKDTVSPSMTFSAALANGFVNSANANGFPISGSCDDSAAKIQILDKMINCNDGTFATNLDLNSYAEGELDLVARIEDSAGNSATSSLGLIKDTIAPSMAFANPSANSFINNSNANAFAVSGSCDDREANIHIFDQVINCDGVSFNANLDLNSYQEGTLDLVAKIEDKAGNSTTSSLGLIKDSVSPSMTFSASLANSFVNSANTNAFAVTGTCDDSTANIQILDKVINCDGKSFSANFDLNSYREGTLDLVAKIEDKAGNSTASSLRLVKDTISPSMNFSASLVNGFVNNSNANAFAIFGTCNDSTANIQILDRVISCNGESFSANFDLNSHQEGTLDLTANIEDRAGNSATSSLVLVKDTTLPIITFTHPAIDSFVNSTNLRAVTVSGTCNEENGNIQLLDDGRILLGQTTCQKSKFSLAPDFSLSVEGDLNLIATIEDTAKNTGQTTLQLNKDTVVPVVSIETPIDKSFINVSNVKAFEISGHCDDKNSDIQFLMGEKILGNTKCDGSKFTAILDLTTIPEGALSLLAKIEDSAGNSRSASLSLTRDTIAPEIAITDPINESFINASSAKTASISGTCSEKAGAIRLLDGEQVLGSGSCDGSRFSINLDLSSKKDGKLDLIALIQDAAKNEGRSNLSLVKDTLPPEVAISFPYPRSFISAEEVNAFNIRGTCNDDGAQIYFSDEEGDLGSVVCDGGVFNTNLDFSLAWDGALILTVEGQDLAGNTNSMTLPLIKDTVAPKISINTPYRGSYFSAASMKSVSISGNCNDPQATVRLTESGQLLGRSACDGTKYSAVVDFSVIHRRNLILEATITDVAGNSRSTSINLTKDTSPPSIALVNPIDGFKITSANVLSPVNVSGNCNEAEALIEIAVDGNVIKKGIPCDGTSFDADVDFSAIKEGKKTLVANIIDKAKNTTQTSINFSKEVRPFVSVWETKKANESIQLHLKQSGSFDFIVDWGDGSPNGRVTSYDDEDIDHTYAVPGKYKVVINGLCSGLDGVHNFGNNTHYRRQLVEVSNLGNVGWTDLSSAFFNASQLIQVSGGDTSQVVSMRDMFRKARKVVPDTSTWQTSNVTNMSYLFAGAINANPDVSKWDTSNVVNMEGMFYGAKNAVPNTSSWETFNVTNMKYLFAKTEKANPDVSNWDTSNVRSLEATFYGALIADPVVTNWNVDQVETMAQMFERATNANPDVSKWKTVSVSNMMAMFAKSEKANPDVSNWHTDNVTNMRSLFEEAQSAEPNVSEWKTGNVVSMRRMFRKAIHANPNVSGWDVSLVEDMNAMFEGAIKADPDVSNWETGNVVNFMRIFAGAVSANPDVSGWDVSQAVFLLSMFDGAINANPDMGQWNFKTGAISVQNFIDDSGLSDTHYSKFLAHLNSINPDFRPRVIKTNAKYQGIATDARTQLKSKGWIIDDGGQSSN